MKGWQWLLLSLAFLGGGYYFFRHPPAPEAKVESPKPPTAVAAPLNPGVTQGVGGLPSNRNETPRLSPPVNNSPNFNPNPMGGNPSQGPEGAPPFPSQGNGEPPNFEPPPPPPQFPDSEFGNESPPPFEPPPAPSDEDAIPMPQNNDGEF